MPWSSSARKINKQRNVVNYFTCLMLDVHLAPYNKDYNLSFQIIQIYNYLPCLLVKRGALESPGTICKLFQFTFDFKQIRLKEQCVLIYAQQCCQNHTKSTQTFGLCLSKLKLWVFPQLQRPLALYQEPIVINIFDKKDEYGKYLLFVTLESYVVGLGDKVFKFP